ncbi:LuxR family two component transcriptional regulator [Natranaerovirga pectinivora]|uniref:Stage 0 sporulation protein A homolog n=1 Tax=Natranaerovirga pectinivora TaxID=682400 RepID=A0A4R3MSQ2_9FIRM|nr:response regulator transcription factor [Natranaerovirga pectinivora]TCT16044.1 LuxR family two component transcriptional regulator [Natranaerovirga pectinivora]
MIKVLLVDDDTELMDNLELILTYQGKMSVVGKATDGKDALEQLKHMKTDVILLDLNMKGMGGIDAIPYIKKSYPNLKIMVLTTFYDDHYITEAIKKGADGYLLKDSNPENIIDGVKHILTGQSILDNKVMNQLAKMMLSKKEVKQEHSLNFSQLTKREMEVCTLLSEGNTNSAIATQLYISQGTVKNYISSIYDKLEIRDRATLVVKLRECLNKN